MSECAMGYAERFLSLRPGSFPFNSRFVNIGDARLHLIDEGEGPVLFMLHGNPTWSYLYRHLIRELRQDYRCIALDLAGFGLSRPPDGFSFKARDHVRLVSEVLRVLDIRQATLIAHDWGGPIGIAAMGATQDRISRLCLGNTWAWRVNGDFHFEWFSKLLGGALGRWAAYRFAVFVNLLMPTTMKRHKLTEEEMAAYRAPFTNRAHRTPMHVFPAEITNAGAWLDTVESIAASFKGPVQFIWPSNDIAFRVKELDRWLEMFPEAYVKRIDRCGHYLWEDAPEECVDALRRFLTLTHSTSWRSLGKVANEARGEHLDTNQGQGCSELK